jgi:hypothetical protein
LESGELHLKKDFLLESLGDEEITSNGQKLSCTKFRLTSRQIRPAYFWVTADGRLQRILLDDRKIIDLSPDDPPPEDAIRIEKRQPTAP